MSNPVHAPCHMGGAAHYPYISAFPPWDCGAHPHLHSLNTRPHMMHVFTRQTKHTMEELKLFWWEKLWSCRSFGWRDYVWQSPSVEWVCNEMKKHTVKLWIISSCWTFRVQFVLELGNENKPALQMKTLWTWYTLSVLCELCHNQTPFPVNVRKWFECKRNDVQVDKTSAAKKYRTEKQIWRLNLPKWFRKTELVSKIYTYI